MALKLVSEKKSNAIQKKSVSEVLTQLMAERRLRQRDISRETGIPGSTLNRLLLGGTEDPKASVLIQLANYFGLSVGQILGTESLPIPDDQPKPAAMALANLQSIPVIAWSEINNWMSTADQASHYASNNWIVTDKKLSRLSFAIKSSETLVPWFEKDSILIVDPEFKFLDANYIVVALDGINPTIRRVCKDGGIIYLKSIQPQMPLEKLESHHRVYGTIVQTRYARNLDS